MCTGLEARRVLNARGKIATTKESNTCEDLDDFAMGLQFMRIMPYSGMTIKLGGQHACSGQTLAAHDINVAYEEIRDLIPWRALAVQFYRDWYQHEDCPGFLLLKKLLPLIRSLLQEFSLLVVTNRRPFLENVLQDYSFSNLSTLKFRDVDLYTSSEEYTSYINNVVSRTPNLQTLYTEGFVNLRENLLEGSRAVHVTDYPYSPSLDEIPESAVGSLRMKRLMLVDINEDFNLDRFNRITFNLLEASRTILTWMHIDFPFVLPLMAYGISLRSVRKLNINLDMYCNLRLVNRDAWNRMKSFDFNRTFPSLDTIEIKAERPWLSYGRLQRLVNAFIGVAGQGQENVAPGDRAIHVKNLNVNCYSDFTRRTTTCLAQMFPHVRKLSIRAKKGIPFDWIWRAWPHLEELDVAIEDRYVSERDNHEGVYHPLRTNSPDWWWLEHDEDYVHYVEDEDWMQDYVHPERWDDPDPDYEDDSGERFPEEPEEDLVGLKGFYDDDGIDPDDFVRVRDPALSGELDGDFCGIFPEEVAQLRKEDEEYLQNLHIVPVKPSVANLNSLRSLNISLESTHSNLRIDPLIWFSKVTPLIAFKNCPNLQVTITTDDEKIHEALSHLMPYVQVTVSLDSLN